LLNVCNMKLDCRLWLYLKICTNNIKNHDSELLCAAAFYHQQIDLRGDISGLLRAHPLAPLVSLHHLDHVYPLYPGADRAKAVEHFFRAANADPARIVQQTVCYDHARSLTAPAVGVRLRGAMYAIICTVQWTPPKFD
jgi:hypothetical protein